MATDTRTIFMGAVSLGLVVGAVLLLVSAEDRDHQPVRGPRAPASELAPEASADATAASVLSTIAAGREPRGETTAAPASAAATALAIGQVERPAGTYPWTESESEPAPMTEAAHVYGGFHLDLDFDDDPLLLVLARLNATGLPPIAVDPSFLAEIEAERFRVKLKVRDVTALNALNRILACREGLGASFHESDVLVQRFERPGDAADPRRLPIKRIFGSGPPRPPVLPFWIEEYRRTLARTRCTCDFRDATLYDAVQLLEDKTDLNFAVSKAIDGDQILVNGHFEDRPAAEILDALMADANLATALRDETIVVVPGDEAKQQEPPELPSKCVTVELRAATLPDLVAALARQGVPSLVSPEGWDARGTFSLSAVNVTVAELASRIAAVAPLQAWTLPESDHLAFEIFVIAGALPSVRQALELEVPPGLAGVAAEVAELRSRLPGELLVRETARGDPGTSAVALAASELAVDRTAAAILRQIERARYLAGAPARCQRIGARIVALGPRRSQAVVDLELARRRAAGDDATIAKLKAEFRLDRVEDEIATEYASLTTTQVAIALLAELERGKRLPREAP